MQTSYPMASCGVCDILLDKVRVHYGGISCTSCRQFFKRSWCNTKSCAKGKSCVVVDGKLPMCSQCRYAKCFAIGMQKDIYLNKVVKRKRGKLINQEEEVMKKTCTTTKTNFGRGGQYKDVSPRARRD